MPSSYPASYTYDSLSNLLTRNDTSAGVGAANVGTQEIFQYDNLNRLTMSSFYGGAITPAKQVQVMYDPLIDRSCQYCMENRPPAGVLIAYIAMKYIAKLPGE